MLERDLQTKVADYLRIQYPKAIFHSDYGSGIKLTVRQATIQKRQNGGRRGWPDMFIAEPFKEWHGLFIELKKDGTRLKKKDGTWASDHIAEQAKMMVDLEKRGYLAKFAVGFEEAKDILDSYLNHMGISL